MKLGRNLLPVVLVGSSVLGCVLIGYSLHGKSKGNAVIRGIAGLLGLLCLGPLLGYLFLIVMFLLLMGDFHLGP